jgi:hypothetical protein
LIALDCAVLLDMQWTKLLMFKQLTRNAGQVNASTHVKQNNFPPESPSSVRLLRDCSHLMCLDQVFDAISGAEDSLVMCSRREDPGIGGRRNRPDRSYRHDTGVINLYYKQEV